MRPESLLSRIIPRNLTDCDTTIGWLYKVGKTVGEGGGGPLAIENNCDLEGESSKLLVSRKFEMDFSEV